MQQTYNETQEKNTKKKMKSRKSGKIREYQ